MLRKKIQQSLKSYLNKRIDMKYLDLVELVKEKPVYTKAGVKLGGLVLLWVKKTMGNGKGAADDKVRRRDCRQNKNTTKSRVFRWSCWPDLNWWPHPYQGCALPPEPQQRFCQCSIIILNKAKYVKRNEQQNKKSKK